MLTQDKTARGPQNIGFDIDLKPLRPDENGRSSHWQAKVSVKEGAKEGNLGYSLSLLTDVEMPTDHSKPDHGHDESDHGPSATPQFYRVNVSISSRILGALSFDPPFLTMGLVRPGQVVPRIVKVTSHDPSIDLSKMKASLRGTRGTELAFAEHFSTSVKPSTKGNGVDVEIRLNGLPEGSKGSFRGDLVIDTGVEEKPEIVVHFSGTCRAGVR